MLPPSPEAVRAALDEMLASQAFRQVDRPTRFLRYLVDATLSGDSDQLKESVLGVEVFGRPPSWDPRLDTIVRQEASRLRKRIARYYETVPARPPIRIHLPVGSYVPQFLASDPAVAPADAPATPGEDARALPARTRARGWIPTVAVLGLAATIAAMVYVGRTATAARDDSASLVVLPFKSLSDDPANQYFVDGLTDEITDLLARNKALRVVARSSAEQFGSKLVDVRDIGKNLKVSYVLEGSVARVADRMKVVARLERASDGTSVWSNTYERRDADWFAVQSDLAAGIAESLRATAGLAGTSTHVPPKAAHSSVLRGTYDYRTATPEALKRAVVEFQHAIDLDPDYGAAYANLASAKYSRAWVYGSDGTKAEIAEAMALYRKAIALSPELPAPHANLAFILMQYDWDWGQAERELRSLAATGRNANACGFYGLLLLYEGRTPEADRYLAMAQNLDPFGTSTLNDLLIARNLERRYDDEREVAAQFKSVSPQAIAPDIGIGLSYLLDGRPALARPVFASLRGRTPGTPLFEAMVLAREGRRDEALRMMQPLADRYPNAGVPMQWFALVYAFLGDEENTVKWLERSADRRELQVLNMAIHPVYDAMQTSPSFVALKRRIGLR